MEKIIESVKTFLSTGNNLPILIVLAVIVVSLLTAVIVTSIQKKRVEKKVAEEESMIGEEEIKESRHLNIETIVLSPIVDEEDKEVGAVVVNNETASQVADETVIMTPVREKKRPIKKKKEARVAQEKESSFVEPIPSPNDGKLPGSIQIYVDNAGKYRFRFHSSNGLTIGHSQSYVAKAACRGAIQAVVREAGKATITDCTKSNYVPMLGKSVFEIYKDKENKFRFRLMSQTAMNLLASQGYTAKANCLKGIESIIRIAEYHSIVDDTLA